MTEHNRVGELQQSLAGAGYIADRALAATLLLFTELQRPLLLEGDAGVGKTEVARVLSDVFACPLIRLQCYEGLDVNSSVYEWNYQHQLLAIKLLERGEVSPDSAEQHIFSQKYLLERPLLRAITQPDSPVLLIDEIDRADEEFEAYLLELLSDFQISVPELGTITARSRPYVILTSNGTRELSDALRRRCLYHYLEYPDFDKELSIIHARVPEIGPQLARQVVAFVQELRKQDLRKKPGVAEALDWVAALLNLRVTGLAEDPQAVVDSLVCLLKTREDRAAIHEPLLERLIAQAV
ncbi:MoxR family ATPase [Candidatus Thiothrix sp. Deng01]|uniref:MoxR family ATPase n=1 Tax=Candidatus Thiothrix phosphatis TaxID=3112415 RepID=A0ABU6D2I9_9GAMM|nr:MoxR family ATPase [Candidatus Thiothrix sp. Deng01]MEB4593240.1 MoxR family ATPase [Candidatus Thiothrix sp. Deng01]